VFPLFALNLALVWWAGRRYGGDVGRGRVRLTVGVLAVAIVGIGFLKTAVIAGEGQNSYGIGIQDGLWTHLERLGWGVVAVNLGTYLVAVPRVLWWIVANEFSILNVVIAAAIGALTFAYLRRLGVGSRVFGGRSIWGWLVGVGLVAFILGYAIFLTTSAFLFRSAGIDNRINAAAALGLSAMLVGTLGYLAERFLPGRRAAAFAAGIACVVAGGVFVVQSLGSFWTGAAERQRTILSAILADADSIPDAGILILDGACPEVGPVPVFADENDLENALKLHLDDDALEADVAAEGMQAGGGMLAIEIRSYRTSTRSYPLGERLVVYDYPNRRLYALRDEEDARRYLGERVTPTCRRQRSFAWGFDSSRPWWFR
jgi:hypothetical protein